MILRGLLLLARGRAEGIKEFTNSENALAASLAPLIAFPLVGAVMTAADGQARLAIIGFLARLCAVLAAPLIVFELARLGGRQSLWLRTAAALDWSFWLLVPLLLAAGIVGGCLVAAGVNQSHAIAGSFAAILGYLFWSQWFVVRTGLNLRPIAAAAVVAAVWLAIALCSAGPEMISRLTPGLAGKLF